MQKAYMIAECMGQSIYDAHTIGFVYMKREWAEYQMRILQANYNEDNAEYRIREVQIVTEGPE